MQACGGLCLYFTSSGSICYEIGITYPVLFVNGSSNSGESVWEAPIARTIVENALELRLFLKLCMSSCIRIFSESL